MKVSIPKEIQPGERRVALVPASVKRMTGKGVEVVVDAKETLQKIISYIKG